MSENKLPASEEADRLRNELDRVSSEYSMVMDELQMALAVYKIVYTKGSKFPSDYLIVNINRKYSEFTGLTLNAIKGKSVRKIFAEDAVRWESNFKEAIRTKEPVQEDWYSRKSDRWLDIKVSCADGDVLIVTFSDISKRKKTEAALKEKNEEYQAMNEEYLALNEELMESHSRIQELNEKLLKEKENAEKNEALYFTIFNTIKEGIFIYRSKDKLEYINPAGCKMHGMSPEEILSLNPREFIHPDTYSVFLEFIAAVDNNQEYFGEANGVTSENEKFDVLVYGCPIYINGEKLYYSTIFDVTQQRRYEAEIEEKNGFIQRILDLNPNQIYIYDLENYQNYYFNRTARDFLGMSIDQMKEMKEGALQHLVYPDDLEKVMIHLQKFSKAKDGDVFQIEYRMRNKVGEYRWFFSKDAVFGRNNRGDVNYIIATATDVTERKIIEQRLEAQNKEIIAQNEEYLAIMEELEESNTKLVKVNEELDSFVYRVSHDLRAPIASSLGLANLSLQESSLEYIRKYSHLQIESLQRLDNFIKDILDYSRNSRLNLKKEKFNLSQLIGEIVQIQQGYEFRQKKIKFIYDDPDDVTLYSDKLRIKIILNNLLSNAFKYYDEDKVNPFVKLVVKRSSNDDVVISIKDNGLGIADDHLDKIYEMFYRATEKRTGSGLGLYIVKDCLSKVEGMIEMKTSEGEGTEFIVTVPQLAR